MFKNIDGMQKGAASAGKKQKGSMKDAADAAEQIRKWVSFSLKPPWSVLCPKLLLFWMKFCGDALQVSLAITRSLQILFEADFKLST